MLFNNIMVLLITPEKAHKQLVVNTRAQRLQLGLTQKGLSERSGVPLPTLRKFEQKGLISLESFLKIQMVLGGLEEIIKATQIKNMHFSTIDDVLEADRFIPRKRGHRN